VQDILDHAAVGRTTFYAHFRDKEALLAVTFDALREQFAREPGGRGPTGPERAARLIFQHVHRNGRFYRAVWGQAARRHLHRMVRELLGDPAQPAEVPAELTAEFHAGAILGLLRWWIDHDFPHGPEWLAGTYCALASPEATGWVGQRR
jgi:AcrR family transcriptional regulator